MSITEGSRHEEPFGYETEFGLVDSLPDTSPPPQPVTVERVPPEMAAAPLPDLPDDEKHAFVNNCRSVFPGAPDWFERIVTADPAGAGPYIAEMCGSRLARRIISEPTFNPTFAIPPKGLVERQERVVADWVKLFRVGRAPEPSAHPEHYLS